MNHIFYLMNRRLLICDSTCFNIKLLDVLCMMKPCGVSYTFIRIIIREKLFIISIKPLELSFYLNWKPELRNTPSPTEYIFQEARKTVQGFCILPCSAEIVLYYKRFSVEGLGCNIYASGQPMEHRYQRTKILTYDKSELGVLFNLGLQCYHCYY